MIRFLFVALLATSFACQTRKVTRIDPSTEIDLSGRWNDTDSRKVADQMIYDLFDSDKFKDYSKQLGRKPVIVMGLIRNKTSEHIDAENFVKKFEYVIHNSNAADIVESDEFRDKLRVERTQQQDFADPATAKLFGKELGADIMLFGEITSEVDTYNKRRVVNYITTLFLTDIETNRRVWYGQNEIKKYVKN
ncbi:penicillin-binding protein activator LpoB [Chryseosolibacter indicus]|uniref:Penicillin-binding protein activator LpoB n=1 Tax=Chryseosolibacter indicus TaxID=2782351 RepID=A0ABS5VJX9_9BACT|nr:penicillin-binding protein activator LpoB [Chryseosolibacter indicus]MBT1701748.1 penicillin-binding protein activator LpoB [Chryseosolibacter indicus]